MAQLDNRHLSRQHIRRGVVGRWYILRQAKGALHERWIAQPVKCNMESAAHSGQVEEQLIPFVQ